MKKLIIVATLLFVCNICTYAQHQLAVELKDGRTDTFLFSDKPIVTFQDTLICITSDKTQAEYGMHAIVRFHFDEVTETEVEEIKEHNLQIDCRNENQIVIIGLTDKSDVRVFDISGRRAPAEILKSDDVVTVNLENLPEGIYLIALPDNRTIKIKKL